ncbi:hypothetical protein B1A98_00300 [Bacillus badius]|nr:hypothetical protein B1A98_00300 [Bacillus badius]
MYIFIPFVKNSSFYCFFHQGIRHELDEGRFFLKGRRRRRDFSLLIGMELSLFGEEKEADPKVIFHGLLGRPFFAVNHDWQASHRLLLLQFFSHAF